MEGLEHFKTGIEMENFMRGEMKKRFSEEFITISREGIPLYRTYGD
jgi:hypothetical protein